MVQATAHPNEASIPVEAEFVRICGKAASVEDLHRAANLLALCFYDLSDKQVRHIAGLRHLRALCLYKVNKVDISGIGACTSLEYLRIDWAHYIGCLGFLSGLSKLRTLALVDLRRFDLSTLPEMPSVLSLYIAGAMWTDMRLSSFEPITRLANLRMLDIGNVRVDDETLRPISKLRHLVRLNLPNLWSVEEHARLAASLPGVQGNGLDPIFCVLNGIHQCDKMRRR